MSKDEVLERVQVRLEQTLNGITREKLGPEVSLKDDLELDSLWLLECTMALEEEFGIEMIDADLPRLRNIGDLADYVLERMAA